MNTGSAAGRPLRLLLVKDLRLFRRDISQWSQFVIFFGLLGLYFLGLHLTPINPQKCTAESWSATRGHLSVVSNLWSMGTDPKKRIERIGVTYDVYTPTKQFRITDETAFRMYSALQMFDLLVKEPRLRLLNMYDFRYDIESPIDITADTEDVVYVLQRV